MFDWGGLSGSTPDPQAEARSNGYSWGEIWDHIATATSNALGVGYTQKDVDQHLGYQDDTPMWANAVAQWTNAAANDPKITEAATSPEPVVDLTASPNLMSDYAQALKDRQVKGPRDFADGYAGAAMKAMGDDGTDLNARQQAAGAASAAVVPYLPTNKDLTDATVGLDDGTTDPETIRNNLIDNWRDTGEHPLAAAMRAQGDWSAREALTAPPAMSAVESTIDAVLKTGGGVAAEFGLGVGRAVTGTVIGLGHISDAVFTALANVSGSDDMHGLAVQYAGAWDALQKRFEGELKGTDWAHAGENPIGFAAGVAGETVPTVMEYIAAGIPAMIVYGIMHGADAAFRDTGSWAAAAAGAVIGGASAGAPAPFLHGAAGKSIVDNAVRGAAGMGLIGGIQSVTDQVPRAIATGEWSKISWEGIPEGVVRGAIGGALIGTYGGVQQMRAKVVDSSKPPGETETETSAAEALAPHDAELHNEAKALAGLPPEERVAASTSTVKLGPVEVRETAAGGEYEHWPIMGQDGEIGHVQVSREGDIAHIDRMGVGGPAAATAMGTPNLLGPRAIRQLARDYFDANPDVNTITGFRMTGARGIRNASDMTVTRDQLTGRAEPDPKQLQELATGYDTAGNTLQFVKGLMGDLLTNTEGSVPRQPVWKAPPTEPPTAAEQARADREAEALKGRVEPVPPNTFPGFPPAQKPYVHPEQTPPTAAELERATAEKKAIASGREPRDTGRNFQEGPAPIMPENTRATREATRDVLRSEGGLGEQEIIHFGKLIDGVRSILNPHMPEWMDALKSGVGMMQTTIGRAIQAMEGRTFTFDENGKRQLVTFDNNDPLKAVFDTYAHVNEALHDMVTKRVAEGKLDAVGYVKDYWAHLWEDPNAALTAWNGGGSGQGRSSGFKERSVPTTEDGLNLGLKLKIPDPGDLMLYDVSSKIKFLHHLDTMDRLENQLGILVRSVGDRLPFPGAERVIGRSTERATADGIEYAWMPAGAARLYNNALSQGWYSYPQTGTTFQKLMWLKNTSVATKMIVPLFHSFVIAEQTLATGGQQVMSELRAGNFGQAAIEAAKTIAIVPKAKEIAVAGYKAMQDYANMTGEPIVQGLVESGARFGKRQLPYQTGQRDIVTSIIQNKGHVIEAAGREIMAEARSTLGQEGESLLTKGALFVPRVAGVGLNEMSRITTTTSAPLFDHVIPVMKAGSAVLRAEQFMRLHPDASPEAVQTRMRQIVDNIDDRFGEMNQDNLFWNKWTKQTANMASISTSWAYGTWRWLAAGSGYNIERGAEWNPEATTSLISAMVVYAGANAIMTMINTHEAPRDVWDFLNFRTGGRTKTGAEQRGLLPTEFKELYDMGRIVVNGMVSPMSVPQGLAHYVAGKENPVVQAFTALLTGEDALGHKISDTPRGWTGYFMDQVKPIIFNNISGDPPGTGLNKFERTFIREAPAWVEDPQAYYAQQTALHNRWGKEELRRAQREARDQGIEGPPGAAPSPRQKAMADGERAWRTGVSGGAAAAGVTEYSPGRARQQQRRMDTMRRQLGIAP